MNNDWQYMGQFSGEDHTTFEQWSKAYGYVLRNGSMKDIIQHFKQFMKDRTFMIMLSDDQRQYFFGQMRVIIDLVKEMMAEEEANPASET